MDTRRARMGPLAQYGLLAGPLLSMVDSSIVNVAAAPIAAALHTDLDAVSWTISGYLLAMGVGLAATSYLARRLGTAVVYQGALVGFTLASAACAAAPGIVALVLARAAQGLTGAALVPLAMSMLLGAGQATRAMSPAAGILLFLGPALGPTVGGALVEAAGWRALFLINVPAGLVAVWACRRIPAALAPGRVSGTRFDPVGFVLLAGGLTAVSIGAGALGTQGLSTATSVSIGSGLAVLAGYLLWTRHTAHPVLDPNPLRGRVPGLALVLCSVASVVTFAAVFLIPAFLQVAQHYSVAMTGLALLPQGVVTGVATIAGQRLLDRFTVRATVLAGFTVLTAATAAVLAIDAHTPLWVTTVVLAARAAAIGLVITPLLGATLREVGPDRLADANTLFTITQRIAAALGVGALAGWYTTTATTLGPVSALHHSTTVLLCLTVIALPLTAALPPVRNTTVPTGR